MRVRPFLFASYLRSFFEHFPNFLQNGFLPLVVANGDEDRIVARDGPDDVVEFLTVDQNANCLREARRTSSDNKVLARDLERLQPEAGVIVVLRQGVVSVRFDDAELVEIARNARLRRGQTALQQKLAKFLLRGDV